MIELGRLTVPTANPAILAKTTTKRASLCGKARRNANGRPDLQNFRVFRTVACSFECRKESRDSRGSVNRCYRFARPSRGGFRSASRPACPSTFIRCCPDCKAHCHSCCLVSHPASAFVHKCLESFGFRFNTIVPDRQCDHGSRVPGARDGSS